MKEGHVRKRHPKLFKRLTIGGSIFGIISVLAFVVLLILDMCGVNYLLSDTLRTYTATFISDGAVISEQTYRRGEALEQPPTPEKQADGEKNYIFLGWDYTGEGIPDALPMQMYFSFTARAVFYGFGNFNLSLEDLMNMDIETLMKLLEDLNIDWEQFMEMFNLSPEDLMNLLSENPVLTFTSSGSQYVSYFRTTSYGDFNYKKKKFNNASAFDAETYVNKDSINPLHYTADKLSKASALGYLPEEFSMVNYNITYKAKKNPFSVPDCEVVQETNESRKGSDAYSTSKPVNNFYQTEASYCPAFYDVIKVLRLSNYSNTAITKDERNYYKYAKENYTSVPTEYHKIIDDIIEEEEFEEEDYYYVDKVGAYVESVARFNMIDEEGNIDLSAKKNKDPIVDMLENEIGSDYDFNTLAVMIFRRLGIPARMVQGYILPQVQRAPALNMITLLNQHYWCEIYVQNIGWMICDCTNGEQLLGFNPYGGNYDNKKNPISNEDDEEPEDPNEFEENDYISNDLSGDVSMEGPGDRNGNVHNIFEFTSDYEGTMYFRSKAYNKYYTNGEWDATYELNSSIYRGYSPLTYAYRATSPYYESERVNIVYLESMKYGVSPAYTDAIPSRYAVAGSDLYTTKEVPLATTQSYNSLFIPMDAAVMRKIANAGIKDSSYSYAESTYYNSVVRTYYLEQNSSAELSMLFEQFISRYNLRDYRDNPDLIVKVYEAFGDYFTYDINFPAYPSNVDPVISFMKTRTGICNNFASACTLLFRYLGVPARFVTGYGAQSRGKGLTNTVDTNTAHAWVEVYLRGVGWVTVDPTTFDTGDGDGTIYGGGFGGNGSDHYEPIIEKHTLNVSYNNIGLSIDQYEYQGVTYTEYYKTYDGQPLYSGRVYIENTQDIQTGHRVVIDDSALVELGRNEPGYYDGKVSVKVYDEDNKDVTDEYYIINDPGIDLRIDARYMTVEIGYNGSISYNGADVIINETTNNYFVIYNHYGSSLLYGHQLRFIPDETIINDTGEYELTGTVVVIDIYNGNRDVTHLYEIECIFPTITVYGG